MQCPRAGPSAWTVAFFFASAGASAAYLTVSEVFPLEIRAMAIAFFFAVATAIGGITRPLLFGYLVGTGKESMTMIGFLIGAAWMLVAAAVELALGVDAEQKSLEEIAEPLSAEAAEDGRDNGDRSSRDGADGFRMAHPAPARWRADRTDAVVAAARPVGARSSRRRPRSRP